MRGTHDSLPAFNHHYDDDDDNDEDDVDDDDNDGDDVDDDDDDDHILADTTAPSCSLAFSPSSLTRTPLVLATG